MVVVHAVAVHNKTAHVRVHVVAVAAHAVTVVVAVAAHAVATVAVGIETR